MDFKLMEEMYAARFPFKVMGDGPCGGPILHFGSTAVYEVPTLSELIDACNPFAPDEFVLNTYCDHWEARHINHSAREEDNKKILVKALTPEEAVARLWLALNPVTPVENCEAIGKQSA